MTTEAYRTRLIDIYEALREFILSYFDLQDGKEADVVIAWIYGTYVFDIFPAFPRLAFYGPKQSGKSKMLDFLSKVCFNAFYSIIPTTSTLFRLASEGSKNGRTILLDEFSLYSPTEKKDLVAILRQGYKKGAKVPRSERLFFKSEEGKRESFIVVEYDVYCPVAFAGLVINDDQLLDRSIAINLLRSDNMDIVGKTIDENTFAVPSKNICMDWVELRDKLSEALWESEANILDSYKLLNSCVAPMSGRDREVWFPLLAIAHFVCEGKHYPFWDNIHAYMRDYISRKKQEDLSTFDLQVLEALSELDLSMSFRANEVADILNRDVSPKEQVTSQAVGQALKRLGIPCKIIRGKKYYQISEEEYKLKRQRFGLSSE